MLTTLQPKILLVTLKYDFKVTQRENSPNEVQKWYPRGTNFCGVLYLKMGCSWQPWLHRDLLIPSLLIKSCFQKKKIDQFIHFCFVNCTAHKIPSMIGSLSGIV